MTRELIYKIEKLRFQLHTIDFCRKEKLLRESRKLDLLIVEYHKLYGAGLNKNAPTK